METRVPPPVVRTYMCKSCVVILKFCKIVSRGSTVKVIGRYTIRVFSLFLFQASMSPRMLHVAAHLSGFVSPRFYSCMEHSFFQLMK